MGLFKIDPMKVVEKGVGIIDQAVIDKDRANELKADLVKSIAENMLTGKGSSVTKITICGLVAIVVIAGTYTFLFHPQNITVFKDYALFSASLIGMLTGAYAAGTTIQTFSKKRE
jgi:hypothetical protein